MSIDKARRCMREAGWSDTAISTLETLAREAAREEIASPSTALPPAEPDGGVAANPDDWGASGAKWAAAFRQMAIKLGYSDMDEGWLIGWFANAIERGRVAHPDTKREQATIADLEQRLAEAEETAGQLAQDKQLLRATIAERDRRIAALEAGVKRIANRSTVAGMHEQDRADKLQGIARALLTPATDKVGGVAMLKVLDMGYQEGGEAEGIYIHRTLRDGERWVHRDRHWELLREDDTVVAIAHENGSQEPPFVTEVWPALLREPPPYDVVYAMVVFAVTKAEAMVNKVAKHLGKDI